jgi:hypothetical protein
MDEFAKSDNVTMKRLLTGWSFRRAIYLFIGVFIIIQSVIEKNWLGVLVGAYFASMGLFAFGCAGGDCYSNCKVAEPVLNKEEMNK